MLNLFTHLNLSSRSRHGQHRRRGGRGRPLVRRRGRRRPGLLLLLLLDVAEHLLVVGLHGVGQRRQRHHRRLVRVPRVHHDLRDEALLPGLLALLLLLAAAASAASSTSAAASSSAAKEVLLLLLVFAAVARTQVQQLAGSVKP